MKLGAILQLLLVLALTSCGGGADTVDETDGDETTSGDEVVEAEGDESLDPCADSEAPCEGESTDGGEGETAEGEGETAEGETAEGEGETAEGEGEARGTEGETVDPQVAWRRQVNVGRQWFIRRCDSCHPDGQEDTGPNLLGIRWPVNRMRRQIRQGSGEGSGRMRPIPPGRLPNRVIDSLMAYMSTKRIVRGVQRPE